MMNYASLALVSTIVLLVLPATLRGEEPQPPEYNQHIAPIFRKYCNGCHDSEEPEGKLALDSYAALLEGGARGAVVQPEAVDRSRLVRVLTGQANPSMPPEGFEAPKPEEVELIKQWVAAGAKGPKGEAPDPHTLVTPHVELTAPARKALNDADFSPDGKLVALAGYGTVRLVSTESQATVRVLEGHRGNVNEVRFSRDGKWLLTAAGEPGLFGEARLWNVADGKLIRVFEGHHDSLYAAVLSPDGKRLATAGYDQQIMLWETASAKPLATFTGHNGAVFDLAFHPEGKRLASSSADRTVKLWDVASGDRLHTFGEALKDVYAASFSPDGKHLVTGGVDNRIRVYAVEEAGQAGGMPLVYSRFAHEGAIIKLDFSGDGKRLVSAAEDHTVKLWSVPDYQQQLVLEEQPDWPTAVALSPDGQTVLVGRMDGTLAFYAAKDGSRVAPPKPELGAATPRGLQRGATTRIKLTGKHLANAKGLKFSRPGVEAARLTWKPDQPGALWAEVAAKADVPLGKLEAWATGSGGDSGGIALYVDQLPQSTEAEPNDDLGAAGALRLPHGVWGTLDRRGDVDRFAFDAKSGQKLVFELSAESLGSKLNGVLTLLGPDGQVVAGNNDFDGQPDPLLAHTAEQDGRYTVRVSDLLMSGSGDHFYRLSVGAFAYVTAAFPTGVPANRESELNLIGYNLPADATVKVKAGAPGEMSVPLDETKYRLRSPLKIAVGAWEETVEKEPNDAPLEATSLSAPGTASGQIHSPNGRADVDLFRFASKAGETWVIETDAARRSSPADTRVEVLDAAGEPVLRLRLQATRDSYVTFRPIDSNSTQVRVKNWEEMGLNQYLYMNGEVAKIFRMPQGPDSGFLFYNWAGKRVCYFDTSPTTHALDEPCYIVEPRRPGEKLIANGLPTFPLYYANDDDAQRKRGRDSRLMFTAPADGDYLVRVSDTRGLGGERFTYRLTVRRPEPGFSISTSGTGPTVHAGGGKELKFTADRADGFNGPIHLKVEGLPPGFAVSQPIVIQAGHTEAEAVVYAQGDAPQPTKENASQPKVTAWAMIGGEKVTRSVGGLGRIKLQPPAKVVVHLEPQRVRIAPGQTVTARLRVERNDFKDRIQFDVNNLPHGVIVDNIGLNGVLIPEGQTERTIFLKAADWVPATERPFHAVARNAGSEASFPVTLEVVPSGKVAQAGSDGE